MRISFHGNYARGNACSTKIEHVSVRMDAEPRKGDLVIALDADRRNTLKKYGGTDKTERRAMLLYCNRRVYGDKVIYVDQLECQGVVSHVIKKK